MNQPPVNPERVADDVARRLLERATALDGDGPTLAQLRQSAAEAVISTAAFDAAVAEWRADSPHHVARATPRRWTERALRNAAGLAVGWSAVAALAVAQRLVAAPWLVHKLTDPIGLAIGAFVAARLRGRTATVLLGGLAVSQGAEFLMDLFSGAPAIHGFGGHMALMIAGVAGVAVGRAAWGRRVDPTIRGDNAQHSSPSDSSESRSVGLTNAEADKRFMELLRLRRSSYVTRLQLS
jgi:hypothetical protein